MATPRQLASAAVDTDNVYDLLVSSFTLYPDVRELSEALAEFRRRLLRPVPRDVVALCTDLVRRSDLIQSTATAWRLLAEWEAEIQPWMRDALAACIQTQSLTPSQTVDVVEACAYFGVTPPTVDPLSFYDPEWTDALMLRLLKHGQGDMSALSSHAVFVHGNPTFTHPEPSARRVGKGSMGSVYVSAAHDDRVIKVVKDFAYAQYVMRERNALMLLRHDHLVRGFSARIHRGAAYMEMERAPYGYVDAVGTPHHVGWMAKQLLSAVDYLHSLELVHGDIRPQNVLVFGPRCIKLCDFDHMQTYESVKGGAWYEFDRVRTAAYPPEMYAATGPRTNEHLRRVDWWGVGYVLMHVAGMKSPTADAVECFVDTGVECCDDEGGCPAYSACMHMMRLDVAERSDVDLRVLASLDDGFASLFSEEEEDVYRGLEDEHHTTSCPTLPHTKRRRALDLNEAAFEYHPECPDSGADDVMRKM